MLKTTSGGKSAPKNEDMLTAYKYALTTRDQLFSARDIENFCRMKFQDQLERVKVGRGIACGTGKKQGLLRTVDVFLFPQPEYKGTFNEVTLGELKIELEKRSPDTYHYRLIIEHQ